jgi:hypothetical protein
VRAAENIGVDGLVGEVENHNNFLVPPESAITLLVPAVRDESHFCVMNG